MLDKELTKTSTPSPTEVKEIIDKEFASGVDEVLIIAVSSGLSGANNFCNFVAADYGDKVKVFDTKNLLKGLKKNLAARKTIT